MAVCGEGHGVKITRSLLSSILRPTFANSLFPPYIYFFLSMKSENLKVSPLHKEQLFHSLPRGH